MPSLPLNIEVHGMTALVVGGGAVAARKVMTLLAAGAAVRVVSPELVPDLVRLAACGSISQRKGFYEADDLADVFLVVAATNDPAVNKKIASDARQRRLLVLVADEPESGNCTFPALLRRGDLEIGVSTNGNCPGFAAVVRDILAGVIGEEYAAILDTLAVEREKLLTEGCNSTYNSQILRSRARELINQLNEQKERVV